MKNHSLSRIKWTLPLLAALSLAACGGGGGASTNPTTNPVAGFGLTGTGGTTTTTTGSTTTTTVTTPPVATAPFIAKVQAAICSDTKNRLYLIDGKQVFSDRAGNCPDNSYARELYGSTPDALLCSQYDSIIGPRLACKDDSFAAQFNTIVKNLDKADLGLGAGHTVEPIAFIPTEGIKAFATVEQNSVSNIISARNIVVRDAAAWAALWAEHRGTNTAPLPAVDFTQKMVVGVFLGQEPLGCYTASIDAIAQIGGKLVINYSEKNFTPTCLLVVGAKPPQPMHLVVLDRSDAQADFRKSRDDASTSVPTEGIAGSADLVFTNAEQIVVKDAASWAALWAAHQKPGVTTPVPAIDFTRSIVVGVAMGKQIGPCFAIDLVNVVAGTSLTVDYATRDYTAICNPVASQANVPIYPLQLRTIPRWEGAIVFNKVPAVTADFNVFDANLNSGVSSEQTVVIRDVQSWAILWATHVRNMLPANATLPAWPPVDFSKKMVIGVFMGARSNGCYGTSISRLLVQTGRYTVYYSGTSAADAAKMTCIQATTAPSYLIVTDRSDTTVDFIRE